MLETTDAHTETGKRKAPLDDFTADCTRAEGFAQALIIIFETMRTLDGEDRARAISAARMLSNELDVISGNLEEGIRECFGNGSPDFPGYANVSAVKEEAAND